MHISKLADTVAPVAFAMSTVSPTWSLWPWVSRIWFTPFIAAALSEENEGLPVKKGSISAAWPLKSRRKAECPYQVICMAVSCELEGGRENNRKIDRITRR